MKGEDGEHFQQLRSIVVLFFCSVYKRDTLASSSQQTFTHLIHCVLKEAVAEMRLIMWSKYYGLPNYHHTALSRKLARRKCWRNVSNEEAGEHLLNHQSAGRSLTANPNRKGEITDCTSALLICLRAA